MATKSIASLPMEKYAKKRERQLKAKTEEIAAAKSPVPAMAPAHDARYDFDTLTRAEEIKRDKPRHRAAKAHAKVQARAIQNIIGGAKRSPSKVKES